MSDTHHQPHAGPADSPRLTERSNENKVVGIPDRAAGRDRPTVLHPDLSARAEVLPLADSPRLPVPLIKHFARLSAGQTIHEVYLASEVEAVLADREQSVAYWQRSREDLADHLDDSIDELNSHHRDVERLTKENKEGKVRHLKALGITALVVGFGIGIGLLPAVAEVALYILGCAVTVYFFAYSALGR